MEKKKKAKPITDKAIKEAIDSENPLIPVEMDKQGLTEDRFRMIESMVLHGHTDSEICDKLKFNKENLIRWMRQGIQDADEGLETIYSQLREAMIGPRLKIVERLKAVLASKALGRYKTKTQTIQKKLPNGDMLTETISTPLPSSKDLMWLLEQLAPDEFGKTNVEVKLRIDAMVPMTPILRKDEWAKKYANRIQDAEVEEAK